MKIRDTFILSSVAGMPVVVPLGAESTFRNMIKLNETGAFLWEKLQKEATLEELADAMVEKYGIDKKLALSDTEAFLNTLRTFGALEE